MAAHAASPGAKSAERVLNQSESPPADIATSLPRYARRPPRLQSPSMVRLAAIVYAALALAGAGINALRGAPLIPFATGPRLLPALLASALMTAATLLFSWFGARRWPWAQRLEATFRAALGPLGTREVLALALLSGVCEEILFRGALQPALIHMLQIGRAHV